MTGFYGRFSGLVGRCVPSARFPRPSASIEFDEQRVCCRSIQVFGRAGHREAGDGGLPVAVNGLLNFCFPQTSKDERKAALEVAKACGLAIVCCSLINSNSLPICMNHNEKIFHRLAVLLELPAVHENTGFSLEALRFQLLAKTGLCRMTRPASPAKHPATLIPTIPTLPGMLISKGRPNRYSLSFTRCGCHVDTFDASELIKYRQKPEFRGNGPSGNIGATGFQPPGNPAND